MVDIDTDLVTAGDLERGVKSGVSKRKLYKELSTIASRGEEQLIPRKRKAILSQYADGIHTGDWKGSLRSKNGNSAENEG